MEMLLLLRWPFSKIACLLRVNVCYNSCCILCAILRLGWAATYMGGGRRKGTERSHVWGNHHQLSSSQQCFQAELKEDWVWQALSLQGLWQGSISPQQHRVRHSPCILIWQWEAEEGAGSPYSPQRHNPNIKKPPGSSSWRFCHFQVMLWLEDPNLNTQSFNTHDLHGPQHSTVHPGMPGLWSISRCKCVLSIFKNPKGLTGPAFLKSSSPKQETRTWALGSRAWNRMAGKNWGNEEEGEVKWIKM